MRKRGGKERLSVIDAGIQGVEKDGDTVGEELNERKKDQIHTSVHTDIPAHPLSGYGRLHSLIVGAGEMCNGWCYQREMKNG